MSDIDISKAILRYGLAAGYTGTGARRRIRKKTICQGCGKDIFSDDTDGVEVVFTRRGDAYFWHSACFRNIERIRSIRKD